MAELLAGRRQLLLAPLLAALPLALLAEQAEADKINPDWTIVRLPDQIKWQSQADFAQGFETAPLFGSINEPGLYLILVKWHPGYMSAPHTYATDRLQVVVSGAWSVNSGADFEPENTVPVPARRLRPARRPHAALRWRQGGRQGARRDRHLWDGSAQSAIGRSKQARLAQGLIERPAPDARHLPPRERWGSDPRRIRP